MIKFSTNYDNYLLITLYSFQQWKIVVESNLILWIIPGCKKLLINTKTLFFIILIDASSKRCYWVVIILCLFYGIWWTRHTMHCVKSVQILSFLWTVLSRIWTEYGDLRSKYPYSVQMRENTDQKKLRIWVLFMQWWSFQYSAKNRSFSGRRLTNR